MLLGKLVRVIGVAAAAAVAASLIVRLPAPAGADAMMGRTGAPAPVSFRVRIENVSRTDQFTASNGVRWTLDFSRGVWYVTSAKEPLFRLGAKDRGQGVKSLSEDGDPTQLAGTLARRTDIASSGKFTVAVNASVMKGIRPGREFEFVVSAKPGQLLGIATMFGQSNDWFYAPRNPGIALFGATGKPIGGDVTAQIGLWDAGTEADEEPGIGPHQGPRQKMIDSGPPDPDTRVRVVTDPKFTRIGDVMRVTVTPL